VLLFLKKLVKILDALVMSWNEVKYLAGVDASGELIRAKQSTVQRQQESRQGYIQCSPADLTTALKSPLFLYYTHMALGVEEIPSGLARESELCPCHRFL
jgi:hypothetical protein